MFHSACAAVKEGVTEEPYDANSSTQSRRSSLDSLWDVKLVQIITQQTRQAPVKLPGLANDLSIGLQCTSEHFRSGFRFGDPASKGADPEGGHREYVPPPNQWPAEVVGSGRFCYSLAG